MDVRARRKELGVVPSFKRVDTCAAEFVAETPYLYSAYESFSESNVTSNKKVLILGAGPNRIGQGIEFDYCCCHASFALRYGLSSSDAQPYTGLFTIHMQQQWDPQVFAHLKVTPLSS